MLGLATLVFLTTRTKIDLVTEEYYPKELKYQEDIQKMTNSAQLRKNIAVTISDSLYIVFPLQDSIGIAHENISGNILIYRPSDKNLDLETQVKLDKHARMVFPLHIFNSGKYTLIVDWKYRGRAFLFKKDILF